jgi:hypothetical protein
MKVGKGDALRQEQGLFCILFVAAWTKRMASGGTRPAGSALALKNKEQQVNDLLLSGHKKEPKKAQLPTQNKQTPHASHSKFFQQPERPAPTCFQVGAGLYLT